VLHCDEETLSLLALGESGPADAEAHVAQCSRCSAELAALRRLVRTARTAPELDEVDGIDLAAVPRIAPPPRVWDQIAAATGVQTHPHPDEVARHTVEPPATDIPAEPPTREPPAVPVQRSRSWTSRSWASRLDGRLLALAASCLVIGLLGGVFGNRVLTDRDTPPDPVVAATRLAGLPAAPSASGQADVTESADGRTLSLGVRQLGVPDGFYEVWLIDRTVSKMVPIGVLSGSQGRFTLPAGVNLEDYPLVDISVEPLDGNPAHSGKSVLRGTLRS
jgi:hypothetical protein